MQVISEDHSYNYTWGEEAENTPAALSNKHNAGDWIWHTKVEDKEEIRKIKDGKYDLQVFALHNVLHPLDCKQYIDRAEEIGFEPAEAISALGKKLLESNPSVPIIWPSARQIRTSSRLIWQVPHSHISFLFPLLQPFLPSAVKDDAEVEWKLDSINPRFRFHKYEKEQSFKPHRDQACASEKGGKYTRSFFSILIYLNDDFEGGKTAFYPIANNEEEHFTFDIKTGSVLVFPHDGTTENVLHAGLQVVNGTKYILRTDAIYGRVEFS